MENFEKWKRAYKAQNMSAFNHDPNGILWLKVRAISRKPQIRQFIETCGISLKSSRLCDQTKELFELLEQRADAMNLLDKYLKEKSHEWYNLKGVDEDQLKEGLHKVQSYDWGGDRNNSLDKYLVSHFVKNISSFDEVVLRQAEIADNAWRYVMASWYNNWTSYIIEAVFKRHPKVIPAVGEIKGVDFFIGDIPVDLKVSFFPKGYIDFMLKKKFGKDRSDSDELENRRNRIIAEAQADSSELMAWLYSNQGEMRFGAENRLFLILADTVAPEQSWKMKRYFELIAPKVNEYLDRFDEQSLKEVDFEFKGEKYRSLADTLFILR